jgi:hypothetical protein
LVSFVAFILAMVLSVLHWISASDYPLIVSYFLIIGWLKQNNTMHLEHSKEICY